MFSEASNVVSGTNICLESVGEEEEEGVRKVLHMGEGDMLSAQGHMVVDDPTGLGSLDSKSLLINFIQHSLIFILLFMFEKLSS